MPKPACGRIKNALLELTRQCIFCFPQIKNESFFELFTLELAPKKTFYFHKFP